MHLNSGYSVEWPSFGWGWDFSYNQSIQGLNMTAIFTQLQFSFRCARIVHSNSTRCETMNNSRSYVIIVVFLLGSRIPNCIFFPQCLLDIHPFVACSILCRHLPLCCLQYFPSVCWPGHSLTDFVLVGHTMCN